MRAAVTDWMSHAMVEAERMLAEAAARDERRRRAETDLDADEEASPLRRD